MTFAYGANEKPPNVLTRKISECNFFLSSFVTQEKAQQNRAMKIGAAIRKIRLERGLTLEQVAFDADTYAGNLSKVERDQHPPSLELLHKIAQVLSIRMSELYSIAESVSDTGTSPLQEGRADYANEFVLMRRHFQTLSPANRNVAIELIKVLIRSQSTET